MQEGVLQHAAMASRKHKPVAIEPVGILGVVPHHLIVQNMAHGRAAHGEPGMA